MKTYTHKRTDGREVKVSVPDDPRPEDILRDTLRDTMSPAAMATIIAELQCCHPDASVAQEVRWFVDNVLMELVGGPDGFNRLADEIGL